MLTLLFRGGNNRSNHYDCSPRDITKIASFRPRQPSRSWDDVLKLMKRDLLLYSMYMIETLKFRGVEVRIPQRNEMLLWWSLSPSKSLSEIEAMKLFIFFGNFCDIFGETPKHQNSKTEIKILKPSQALELLSTSYQNSTLLPLPKHPSVLSYWHGNQKQVG